MEQRYQLSQEQKMYFSSVLVLELMVNCDTAFVPPFIDDTKLLEPIFNYMLDKEYVNLSFGCYSCTKKGKDLLFNHKEKLVEFRQFYKIFSAVDLRAGTFAYSDFFNFDNDEDFEMFLKEERFEDLRVAVCELKNINPLEIIFLEMMDSGAFVGEGNGWERSVVYNDAWEKMVEIANTNIHIEQLAYDFFSGEDVIKDIIQKGTKLTQDLLKKQEEFDSQSKEEVVETVTETTIMEDDYVDEPYYGYTYYVPYYDPFYVSPFWLLMW